jgi:hypothetical protein
MHYTKPMEKKRLYLKQKIFYFLLLAELYRSIDNTKARHYLQKAHSLAKTQTESKTFNRK